MNIPEVLIIEGDEPVMLLLDDDHAGYTRMEPDDQGWVWVTAVPLAMRSDPGGGLAIRSSTDTVSI